MTAVRLGLRENLGQFALLVVVNAFVGAMVGLERSILPAIAEQEFQLAARTAVLSFIVVFGIAKALTNYGAGRLSDRIGRKHVLVLGWLVAVPVPFLLMWAPSWTWMLFANQVPVGKTDPQFHIDLSFFVFTYPFIRMVLSYLFAAVLISLVLAALVHYLYGGLRMQGRRPRVTMAAQAHLFVLFGVFVLLKAVAYWVDRYGIDFSQRGAVTTGASYTDVNAVLPAKTVLAVIAVLCALLFFAGAARRSAMLPAVGFGLLVLSAILIGGLFPAIFQQFVIMPIELAKVSP